MKKKLLLIALIVMVAVSLSAEALDDISFVKRNTGSVASLERLDTPDFTPGQTVFAFISVTDLAVKWGEGQIKWKYFYRSSLGNTIWESPFRPVSEKTSSSSWSFNQVVTVSLPGNIPQGEYGLGFLIVDTHSKSEYRGWADFTINMASQSAKAEAAPAPQTDAQPEATSPAPIAQPSDGGEYELVVEGVRITLKSIEATQSKLILNFVGLNEKGEEQKLGVYVYSTRIIDSEGNEYYYDSYNGGGSFRKGPNFAPGIPLKTDLIFTPPVNTIKEIALLRIDFYGTGDFIELRSIPVPFP